MKDRETADQIATLRGLKMVHFYHLPSDESPICGIIAYYQDKLINLCSGDKYFSALFDRVADIYDSEASLGRILADDTTIHILKQANAFNDDSFEKQLSGYKLSAEPLFLPKAFSAYYLLPIVKYIIQSLYYRKDPSGSETEKPALTIDPIPRQWFGKGMISAIHEDKRLGFPYQIFSMAGECYDIIVRNVLTYGNELKIEISYGYDRITISYYDSSFLYEGVIQYKLTGNRPFVLHELRQKGESVFMTDSECKNEKTAVPSGQALRLLSASGDDWLACRLPWGDTLFSKSASGKEYRLIETHENDLNITYALCFCFLETEKDVPLAFGEYSFRLYERGDLTELHLLEMEQPASGRYMQRYAGRFYSGQDNK